MPSSYHGFLVNILNELLWLKPSTVLDVGIGFGKMGMLFREYCDVFCAEGYGREHWKTTIDGIEVFADYIMDHQRAIYDNIYIGDAAKILPTLPEYDFVYAGDVLEHFDRNVGEQVLSLLRIKAKKLVMCVPVGPKWKQSPVFGNVHETHRAVWMPEDFADASKIKVVTFNSKPICMVVYENASTVFDKAADNNKWHNEETLSGEGSTFANTAVIRAELETLLNSIDTLVDVGCGDCNWITSIPFTGDYYGVDASKKLIKSNNTLFASKHRQFDCINAISEDLPAGDLYLCRDMLVHLCNMDVARVLANIYLSSKEGGTFIATTFPNQQENTNIQTGGWRPLNLQLPPFILPDPITIINEKYDHIDYCDKSLGIWPTSALRKFVNE